VSPYDLTLARSARTVRITAWSTVQLTRALVNENWQNAQIESFDEVNIVNYLTVLTV
jgi:hypothetical protein